MARARRFCIKVSSSCSGRYPATARRETITQFFAQGQSEESTKDMTANARIRLMIDRACREQCFDGPERVLNRQQIAIAKNVTERKDISD
jgi:hypothetical protein